MNLLLTFLLTQFCLSSSKPIDQPCGGQDRCPDGQLCDTTLNECYTKCTEDSTCHKFVKNSMCDLTIGRCVAGCDAQSNCPEGFHCVKKGCKQFECKGNWYNGVQDGCCNNGKCLQDTCSAAGFTGSTVECQVANGKTTCNNLDAAGSKCKWKSNCLSGDICWGTVECLGSCFGKGLFCMGNEGAFQICTGKVVDSSLKASCDVVNGQGGTTVSWRGEASNALVIQSLECVKTADGTSTKVDHSSCSESTPLFADSAIVNCEYAAVFPANGGSVTCTATGLNAKNSTTCNVPRANKPPPAPLSCSLQQASVVAEAEPNMVKPTIQKTASFLVDVNYEDAVLACDNNAVDVTTTGTTRQVDVTGNTAGLWAVTCSAARGSETVACAGTKSVKVVDNLIPTCRDWERWPSTKVVSGDMASDQKWTMTLKDDEKLKSWKCTASTTEPTPKDVPVTFQSSTAAGWTEPKFPAVDEQMSAAFPLGTTNIICEVEDHPVRTIPDAEMFLYDDSIAGTCPNSITVCQEKSVFLIAGQYCVVGSILVRYTNNHVYINYEVEAPECGLDEIHVELNAGTKPIMPATPGQFDVQQQALEGSKRAQVVISLEEAAAGSCAYSPTAVFPTTVMAHASVRCSAPIKQVHDGVEKTCFAGATPTATATEGAWGSYDMELSALAGNSRWATYFNFFISCPCGDSGVAECVLSEEEWGPWSECPTSCGPQYSYRWALNADLNCPPQSRKCDIPDCDSCTATGNMGVNVKKSLACIGASCAGVPAVEASLTFDQRALQFAYTTKTEQGTTLKAMRIEFRPIRDLKDGPEENLVALPTSSFKQNGLSVVSQTLNIPGKKVMEHCDFAVQLGYSFFATVERKVKTKATTYELAVTGTVPMLCRCVDTATGEFILGWTTQAQSQTPAADAASNGWVALVIGGVVGAASIVALTVGGTFWYYRHHSKARAAEALFSSSDVMEAGAKLQNTPFITAAASPWAPDPVHSPLLTAEKGPAPTPDAGASHL